MLNLVSLSQQQSPAGENVSLKHQLLQVIVRVAQYRMLFTGESHVKDIVYLKKKYISCIPFALSSSHSSYRLSEQPLPWFQGIWRHPRYHKQAADCVDRGPLLCYSQESLTGLCLWLSVYREFICCHLAWRDSHERANLQFFLFVVLTHQVFISALFCLKNIMCNSWESQWH